MGQQRVQDSLVSIAGADRLNSLTERFMCGVHSEELVVLGGRGRVGGSGVDGRVV